MQNALTAEEWAANEAVRPLADGNMLKIVIAGKDPQPGGTRHATAALALRDTPFGFTHADVLMLDALATALPDTYDMASLRDRIAALLPLDVEAGK
jgi:hypothetical protein